MVSNTLKTIEKKNYRIFLTIYNKYQALLYKNAILEPYYGLRSDGQHYSEM